ncbi:fumarylacetoacetate hydrolase family protein [Zoogloea sp. LCSB751]|uniref:fumarylacetoacetate hydrolase family protein n=1 Tax=Zoogloea sp. LCSB751 TaxID=1965277 RepID=UPI0009A50127|nr:fumarylacetoacetate hydrolase family protein [Zoogloea sp. LCSB751]
MKIARVADAFGERFWAQVDEDAGLAWRIASTFRTWAPAAAGGDTSGLRLAASPLSLATLRLLAPVEPGARIFGVGLNYLQHLTRLGRKEAPPHTIAYIKPESAVVDPGGEIAYPAITRQLDFEIELVAVVARELGETPRASDCLLGYTIGNDVSARDAGERLGTLDLFSQKALDRTAPIGPWIATRDLCGHVGQPDLQMRLSINGELRQQDRTSNMIFSIDELLDFVDARVTLHPGDLLFTGSTCGVGLEDGRFLRPGDRIEAEIEGIGVLTHWVGLPRVLLPNRRCGRLGLPD